MIDFIQKIDQISFHEAVETLAAKVGIQLRYDDSGAPIQRSQSNQRPRLVEAHKVAAEYYAEQLFGAPEAMLGQAVPGQARLRPRRRRALRSRLLAARW